MNGQKWGCPALNDRGGIFLEHIGCGSSAVPGCHDFIMIAYVAYGAGYHDIDNKTLKVCEGDVFVINPDVVHCFRSDEDTEFMELFYCYFLPDMLEDIWRSLKINFPDDEDFFSGKASYLYTKDGRNKNMRNTLVHMIDEFSHSPAGYNYMLKSYFTILMTNILRRHRASFNNPVYSQNKTVDEVIRYINYHIAYDITVSDIAEANHISEEYLCRLFKKHTGMTVVEFINKIKMEKVADILKNTDRSIENIADYVNCSTSHLKRLFKRYSGMSMNAYRNKYHYKE